MDRKSFLQSANGAILERADRELNQIFENILDPNTRATDKRKLTLTIEFKPNDDRTHIAFSSSVKPSLAPPAPVVAMYGVTADRNGQILFRELTAEIPGQQDLLGDEQAEPNVIFLRKQA